MKKSKLASGLVGSGGALALALAFSLSTSQVAAVPYASQIRFSETQINQLLPTDLLYTLNEDADEVTVEVYNNTTATVVRTFTFTSPAPETQRGRHAIAWDNRDGANNLLPIGGNQLVIRVNVKKEDSSTTWTPITSNSSGKATQQQSIFGGFSSNDLKIPTDPTAEQFGLMFAAHSFNGAPPGGLILFGTDLAPVLGNGGGAANVRGQHPAASPGNFALWKTAFDPLDPDLLWFGGQTSPSKAGFVNIGATNAADIDLNLTESWNTGLFPRGFAVGLNDSNQRIAYITIGNVLYRAQMDTVAPYTLSGEEVLTTATLDGVARYAQETKVDAAGNVYFLNRLPDGDGRLWRWDKAVVDAAPGVLLDETNAAWAITAPAGSNHFNALHIDPLTNEVYVGNAGTAAPRGVYYVGNTADATITKVLTADDLIIDYSSATQFPVLPSSSSLGHGISTDWKGNFYVTNRIGEEIYSFSPPARATEVDPAAEYDITTQSPTGYAATIFTNQTNLAFVDHTDGAPNNITTFSSLRTALLSFGPGGHNHGFAGTNRIEVLTFGPYDEELPDITPGFSADDFEIVTPNGSALVLQRSSSWELGRNVSIDGLVIAASSTSTPSGTLVTSTAGTQTISNSWITALPAAASSYTAIGDIPAGIADGSAGYDGSLVRAGTGLTVAGGEVVGTNVTINQHTTGVSKSSGSLSLNPSKIVSNSGAGVNATGGSLSLTASQVNNNGGSGIISAGAVVLASGSEVSGNGASGIVINSGGSLNSTSTFANPIQIVGNPTSGITYSSSVQYAIRNTLIHGSNVGLDLTAGSFSGFSFEYYMSDVIITGSTLAGIRTGAASHGISAARITLANNGSGILDTQTRSTFWSLHLEDSIIAGPGGIGVNSPGAADSSIIFDYCALVTAGPDALTSATNAPASAFDTDFGTASLSADPQFRNTTYSPNRSGPVFFMAPSNPVYVGAAKPNLDAYEGGSPFQNLGGGSRWVLGPGLTTITVGSEGQLYPTLADAVEGVSALGSTGGQILTIQIETNTEENRVSRLGVDTSGGGGVVIRPKNGVDVTVSWLTAPALSGVFYSGQLAIGANQGVNNDIIFTDNVVLDGRPTGSPAGTQLTFQGPGRHLNLTGGAINTTIRNMVLDSTTSSGAVIAMNSLNSGGVDYHPVNLVIENNLIRAASTSGAHVAIVLQNQNATITTSAEGLVIRNNRIEYNSSAVFFYPAGHGATIYGNEFFGRQPPAGFDARGFYFFTNAAHAPAVATTTNVFNNYFDLVAQTTSTTNGPALISFDFGATPDVQTFNFYNNFISMQTNTAANYGKLQVFLVGLVSAARLNALHNSIHIRAGAQGINPTLNTAAASVVQFAATGGAASVNARNNLIRVEEPGVAIFNTTEQKLSDFREDYNTVYRVPFDTGSEILTAKYGRLAGVNQDDLATWRTATGWGTNSDEAVIAIAPDENPEVGFTGVWTAVADRTTDPNNPVLPNYRWTAVPGDSSVWGGVPGLLTNLPGGNTDIDGTARNTGKPYRGAHEGATLPGDNIPPDEDPPVGTPGDITGDDVINVADVTALADAIANNETGDIPLVVGDLNDDGVINEADLAILIDMIVNP